MRKLVIFLVVMLVLLVGVDLAGRAVAESKAGEAIANKTGTAAPAVHIHGFSFLVQAIPGHYSHISLNSSDVTAGPITGIAATVELYDVDFPLGDALKGDTSRLVAAQATLTGVLADSALTAALPQAGVTISPGTGGAIRVSTTATVLGRQVPVTADIVPSFRAGILHLDATGITAAGTTLPNATELTTKLSLELPLTGLPFTVGAATLTATGTDLVLTATATDVAVGKTGR